MLRYFNYSGVSDADIDTLRDQLSQHEDIAATVRRDVHLFSIDAQNEHQMSQAVNFMKKSQYGEHFTETA